MMEIDRVASGFSRKTIAGRNFRLKAEATKYLKAEATK